MVRGTPEQRTTNRLTALRTCGGRAHWNVLGRNSDRSAEAGRLFVAMDRASGTSGSKDLGGEIEAHGRIGHRSSETAHGGTDPSRMKALKPTLTAGDGLNGASGNANPRGLRNAARERQEGSGRGDTVQLSMGGILRGVGASRERRPYLATGATTEKRGEPHDWQRDATSPRLSAESSAMAGSRQPR
jgi:hypothetical protein